MESRCPELREGAERRRGCAWGERREVEVAGEGKSQRRQLSYFKRKISIADSRVKKTRCSSAVQPFFSSGLPVLFHRRKPEFDFTKSPILLLPTILHNPF
jgi:hypothetical protein